MMNISLTDLTFDFLTIFQTLYVVFQKHTLVRLSFCFTFPSRFPLLDTEIVKFVLYAQ